MFTFSDLRRRGWTAAAVDRYLGAPDDTADNPYGGSHRLKMYDADRVETAESVLPEERRCGRAMFGDKS